MYIYIILLYIILAELEQPPQLATPICACRLNYIYRTKPTQLKAELEQPPQPATPTHRQRVFFTG